VEEMSSNFRELYNLVNSLEEAGSSGILDGCKMFMFTDISTAERSFFNGTSSARPLFDLVVHLRQLEMRKGCKIHVVHVAGTRMINQGTDGLSRGDQNAGVMLGKDFLTYVPLADSALTRSPSLKNWLMSWVEDCTGGIGEILTTERWFELHVLRKAYIWCPAPAAAKRAISCLGQTILKRPSSLHVIVVPRLMTALGRKVAGKLADVILTLPTTSNELWPKICHEPLIMCISFPLSREYPWRLKGSPLSVELESRVPGLWQAGDGDERDYLRKCIREAWRLS
jgi:hypothetical protein